jgi:uncharacterized protein (TIGR02246 family)
MTADLEASVRALYADLIDAWNRRDAKAFAHLFADDGNMVGFDGSQATAPDIEGHLQPIFTDHPTARYVVRVREVRPLGAQAAVLRAIAGMVPPGQDQLNPDLNAVQAVTAEEFDGRWRIVLFQNTPAQYHGRPDLVERHTAELAESGAS